MRYGHRALFGDVEELDAVGPWVVPAHRTLHQAEDGRTASCVSRDAARFGQPRQPDPDATPDRLTWVRGQPRRCGG